MVDLDVSLTRIKSPSHSNGKSCVRVGAVNENNLPHNEFKFRGKSCVRNLRQCQQHVQGCFRVFSLSTSLCEARVTDI